MALGNFGILYRFEIIFGGIGKMNAQAFKIPINELAIIRANWFRIDNKV